MTLSKKRKWLVLIICLMSVAGGIYGGVAFSLRPPRPAPMPMPGRNQPLTPGLWGALEVDPAEVDFGAIGNDAPASMAVTLRNAGEGKAVVSAVRPSCGCTASDVGKHELGPGETTELTVTVDPAKIPGFKKKTSVIILAKGTKKRSLRIPVKVLIDPEFEVVPKRLDFGQLAQGEGSEMTILVRQLGDESITVTDVVPLRRASSRIVEKWEGVEVSITPRPEEEWVAPGRAEYAVGVVLPPSLKPGKHNGVLEIALTCARLPKVRYPIRVRVVDSAAP